MKPKKPATKKMPKKQESPSIPEWIADRIALGYTGRLEPAGMKDPVNPGRARRFEDDSFQPTEADKKVELFELFRGRPEDEERYYGGQDKAFNAEKDAQVIANLKERSRYDFASVSPASIPELITELEECFGYLRQPANCAFCWPDEDKTAWDKLAGMVVTACQGDRAEDYQAAGIFAWGITLGFNFARLHPNWREVKGDLKRLIHAQRTLTDQTAKDKSATTRHKKRLAKRGGERKKLWKELDKRGKQSVSAVIRHTLKNKDKTVIERERKAYQRELKCRANQRRDKK
jgi:hypothetical protein